ncbi:hypothetical protein [Variovorax sp.]|jgi:LexA DNA binding domain|uniref:LexA family protein n=1 Tax=Variovorax sp. TaxID=1871043 RepID=UPI004037F2A2
MTAEVDFEIRAMCQDANRIAARLRGEQYVKPKAINPMKRQRIAKPAVVPQQRKREVTDVQLQVLDFIRDFLARNDQMPPYWKIAEHFGWGSTDTARDRVLALAQKGFLERNEIDGWRLSRPNVPRETTSEGAL